MKEMFKKMAAGVILTTAALILILAGSFRGDLKDIYNKGSLICWECIGLGK